jgi:hypothetical protein
VFLPGFGDFIDFWDGATLSKDAGNASVAGSGRALPAYPAPTARIPVFGRAGTLLPLAPFGMQSVGTASMADPLEVHGVATRIKHDEPRTIMNLKRIFVNASCLGVPGACVWGRRGLDL